MKQPISLSFGLCVRAMRQQQGWTQVEFSERCGFYQTYLSRIETGRANPTLNAMEVIATGLGLSIFELFASVRMVEIAEDNQPESNPALLSYGNSSTDP